ncbi:VOC family protein [Rhodococcoides yunnanense]|uniref:VOC family protein n=1 Tax=Rhodococcoides yunnanense TaxID=278209 RepID=A0ABU4BK93_9NOCA|nr:VOC family protein [Rhodococcus yunnanensis]MDV6264600.1 VOC family protein [Rhodococcus yunnanensis]
MPALDHTIVHSTDRFASAHFLAVILGTDDPVELGPFVAVRLGNDVALDFAEHLIAERDWVPTHYAFTVTDDEFDAIVDRIRTQQLPYWADPRHTQPDAINHLEGGRGVYIHDPDGHNLEFLTRSYSDRFLTNM